MSQRYDDLMAKLDLPAKVRLLTGASFFSFTGDESIGLPPMAMSDGPTGVKGQSQSGGAPTSLLPNATLLASTWSEQTLTEVGEFLADEAARHRTHIVLGPTINLHRSPLGGRVFEAFSEDPLLTGRLAAAYVRGLQERGVAACLKHLVGNEAETERHTVDVRIDEATLREVYLLPFEIAVADADAWLLMAAYNRVNGVPATEHDALLNGIVKDEWGYPGLVVSDFFATHSTAPAINGGLDVVLPGPFGPWGEQLVAAVERGEVAEAVVDDAVRRVLRLADRVGALGAERDVARRRRLPTDPDRREALLRWAVGGMTVLTNDGTLPLAADGRIALVGVPAAETLLMGGGSSEVTPPHQIVDPRRARRGARRPVTYAGGVEIGAPRPRPGRASSPTPSTAHPGCGCASPPPTATLLADEHLADTRRVLGWRGELDRPGTRARLTARIDHAGPLQLGVIGIGALVGHRRRRREELPVDPVTGMPGESLLAPPQRLLDLDVSGPTVLEAEVDLGDLPHAMIGLIARPAPKPDERGHRRRGRRRPRRRRRRRRRRPDRRAGDRVAGQDHPRPARRPGRARRGRRRRRPPHRGRGQRRHPGADAVGRPRSTRSSSPACPVRKAATPSPPPCSASSNPAGRLVTTLAGRRRGHSGLAGHPRRRRARPTRRAPSSATAGTPPGAPRHRRSGSAPGSATAPGTTSRPGSTPPATRPSSR